LGKLILVSTSESNPPSNQAQPLWQEPEILAQMRRDYSDHGLHREDLLPDPIDQFDLWFQQALAAQMPEANAMSLATASTEAQPTLRTVLLKGLDHRGFVFFTNLDSTKSVQIAANPRVALLFPWLALERQVSVVGTATKLSGREVVKYFVTRPFTSQLAAWASPQSQIITSRRLLEMKFAEVMRKFSEGKVPLPSFWGGFRVAPQTVEFWQGRINRLHDRFLYTRQADDSWSIDRLGP
jgi:pyridoxamine 5'-phosphate oxidase